METAREFYYREINPDKMSDQTVHERMIELIDEYAFQVVEKILSNAGVMRSADTKFEVSSVQCDLCNYRWVAVRNFGLDKLECPNCRNIANFENSK